MTANIDFFVGVGCSRMHCIFWLLRRAETTVIVGVLEVDIVYFVVCTSCKSLSAHEVHDSTPSAMRRKSLYPAAGTAVHLPNPAGTLARILFNNFFHNYSLPLNKNQFPTYFRFTFSPVTFIKAGFVAPNILFFIRRNPSSATPQYPPKPHFHAPYNLFYA